MRYCCRMSRRHTLFLSILTGFTAALLLTVASMLSVPARAAGVALPAMSTLSKPLVIIRFNQRKVFYERPLFNALSKAVEIAPDVRFNVISYVPFTGQPQRDRQLLNQANAHLREVMARMREMGIPGGQISVNNELDHSLRHDEIHIFVQ